MNEEHEFYSRQIILDEIGENGQKRLKLSRVLVIGAGGLGCPVLQYLVSAGVGTVGIVDFDTVSRSNLHRQVLYNYNSIGKNKAVEAQKRLSESNPFIEVIAHTDQLIPENAIDIIKEYDIIVDCTDNYESRYLINDACVLLGKPLVYAAIYKFEGQVAVFNLTNGPTYRCLHPNFPKEASMTNCEQSGVLGVLPGIIGTLQANEVLKLLLQIGEPLNGQLLTFSSLRNTTSIFRLKRIDHSVYAQNKALDSLEADEYKSLSCGTVREIEMEEFKQIAAVCQLVDVRELFEEPRVEELNALTISMSELEVRYSEIDPTIQTVIFCQHGIRSAAAINYLQEKYHFTNLTSLKGGIESYTG